MSNFCKQCSIQMFDEDMHDLYGIISWEDYRLGHQAYGMCDICGCIRVDPNGNCIDPDCLEHGICTGFDSGVCTMRDGIGEVTPTFCAECPKYAPAPRKSLGEDWSNDKSTDHVR